MKRNWQTDERVQELLSHGVSSDDIMLIDCRFCHNQSFYDGGFTCGCSWCHEDIAGDSEYAYRLSDHLYAMDYDNYHLGEAEDALP